MAINRQLKELVDKMCEAVDKVAALANLPDGTGEAARFEMGKLRQRDSNRNKSSMS